MTASASKLAPAVSRAVHHPSYHFAHSARQEAPGRSRLSIWITPGSAHEPLEAAERNRS